MQLQSLLASQFSKLFSPEKYILVAGSEGKSLTVQLAKALLTKDFPVQATKGGSDPLSEAARLVLKSHQPKQKVIIEMGLDNALGVKKYIKLFKPGVVIVTNLSIPSGEFVGDESSLDSALRELLLHLNKTSQVYLNWDDLSCRKLSEGIDDRVVFYGMDENKCHVFATNLKIENLKTSYQLNYGVERVAVTSELLGNHLIYPQLAAACLAVSLGVPLTTIKIALESFGPLPGYMEAKPGYNGSTIIDDTCQMSPEALFRAMDTLNLVSAKRRFLVISEISGLGEGTQKVYKELAFKISRDKIDSVYLVGEKADEIKTQLLKLDYGAWRIDHELSVSTLSAKLARVLSKGDVILIKGESYLNLGNIVRYLSKP